MGLKVSTTLMNQEIHNLNISIVDTEVGIGEKARTKLFSAFSQADGSTSRKYGGTGLGLAISRELVSLMGGNLDCKSRVGKGTEFFFTLTMEEGHSALEEKMVSLLLTSIRVVLKIPGPLTLMFFWLRIMR